MCRIIPKKEYVAVAGVLSFFGFDSQSGNNAPAIDFGYDNFWVDVKRDFALMYKNNFLYFQENRQDSKNLFCDSNSYKDIFMENWQLAKKLHTDQKKEKELLNRVLVFLNNIEKEFSIYSSTWADFGQHSEIVNETVYDCHYTKWVDKIKFYKQKVLDYIFKREHCQNINLITFTTSDLN